MSWGSVCNEYVTIRGIMWIQAWSMSLTRFSIVTTIGVFVFTVFVFIAILL